MRFPFTTSKVGYYSVLGFKKEPFSTSPDPAFFYPTKQHETALTNLLIELRLRRGLSVIFGDVGTGKTTLSRRLLHELNKRKDVIFHMILNPAFDGEQHFLISLIRNFSIDIPKDRKLKDLDLMELRDIIERFLIHKTLEENRTVVLIIDEAQKMDLASLETLRILLNFETNDHKLIQLILLGQLELYARVVHMSNFMDRISFRYTLNPLSVEETKELILFRINKAGYESQQRIFLDDAISEIYTQTKGYPRKINMLCHKALKELILQQHSIIDAPFIKEIFVKQEMTPGSVKDGFVSANRS
ncbi:MAG: AAA family ATPase [Candidatus Omnitrophica bacterium]|nr:AAA family ATPase [Candidatus Omnitrophota bacterium]